MLLLLLLVLVVLVPSVLLLLLLLGLVLHGCCPVSKQQGKPAQPVAPSQCHPWLVPPTFGVQ